MKILSSKEISTVDAKTIEYKGIQSYELMEMAASTFTDYFIENYYIKECNSVALFCGTGNNGGDGVAVAYFLHLVGYSVKLFMVEVSNNYSKDCLLNIDRAEKGGVDIIKITSVDQIPCLDNINVIVDAIFGTGLSRPLSGLAKDVIERINALHKPVVSIDIPSGLFMDKPTTLAINATETVTFQIPKLALFLPLNNQFVGHLTLVDIGLDAKAIAEATTDMYYLTDYAMAGLLKPLDKYTHKGIQGHALIVGGSLGKIGAVTLASKAALSSGCGLVTAYLPKCGANIIQSSFPEAMVVQDEKDTHISSISYNISPTAIAIGMGMGQHKDTKEALHNFLKVCITPLVIDADALNILSENPDWLLYLQPNTILTPHPGELSRLIGAWDDDFDKIERTRQFARKYNLIVVIKGAHSLIINSNNLYVNSSGTPALATTGSGDVLSGIIVGLLAQGYSPLVATQLGVYIHGKTANITSQDINPRSFIATHIIENIGKVYDRMNVVKNTDDLVL
jgi:hydroxyethylthiazole kinase-like uncharacterized protein yjeF